ncbi:DUF3369 domain-containing protein [Dendrosporobacter sp. 1207_IL3150]|uniref:DUF3369 domain-containing protein n=1 Tax=Dendrosporobacter sp. 1207_IL3150 TaxID=3084054 RepID=UPI002FD9988C
MESKNEFLFLEDRDKWLTSTAKEKCVSGPDKWKILIVDDEDDVHDVTRMTLRRLVFDGGRIEFFSAFSAAEAREILKLNPDIAVMLLDVVMEEEHAGLALVHYVRRELKNSLVRIILRTGHPGQAPEESVTIEYDINDYREKTELTTQRLLTAVVTALRSYRDLQIIDENRRDLKQVIKSSTQIFRLQSIKKFAGEILHQLTTLACIQPKGGNNKLSGFVAERKIEENFFIHAAIGQHNGLEGRYLSSEMPAEILEVIDQVCVNKCCVFRDNSVALYCPSNLGPENIVYLEGFGCLTDWTKDLVEMFRLNVFVAFDNIYLNQEVEDTQRECIFTLGEIAESRSHEMGNHVKRVGEVARILALRYGLSEQEAELIKLSASMHDLGKLAINDSIVNKPGALTSEEFETIKTHSQMGYEMLKSSKRKLFQTAAIIAREHHENYDGTGYPHSLKETEINIYSRIVALADVIDALGTKRVYKKSWSKEEITQYILEQRGKKFDPCLTDLFYEHCEEIFAVRDLFPDEDN